MTSEQQALLDKAQRSLEAAQSLTDQGLGDVQLLALAVKNRSYPDKVRRRALRAFINLYPQRRVSSM